jgi:hypothetical protein
MPSTLLMHTESEHAADIWTTKLPELSLLKPFPKAHGLHSPGRAEPA